MTGLAYGPEVDGDRILVRLSLARGGLEELLGGVYCFAARLYQDDGDLEDTYRLEALTPTDDSGFGLASACSDHWAAELPALTEQQAEQGANWHSLFARLPDVEGALSSAQGKRLAEILVSVGLSTSQSEQIVRRLNESTTPPERKEPDQ